MIYTGYVAASAKDWDDLNGSSNAALSFSRTNDADGIATVDLRATALLNTSGITSSGSITITAVTFYWRHASLDSAKLMTVGVWDSATTSYVMVYSGFGAASGSTLSTAHTASTILSCINSSGGIETNIYFTCTNPTANLTRTGTVCAFDHTASYTAAPYVVISYDSAATAKRRFFIIT